MDSLVERLQKANWAYHNGEPIMSDDAYDLEIEKLRKLSPNHPFLSVIGAPVSKGVLLPYTMGSQNKIRADSGTLEKWLLRTKNNYIVSDKLDGISALYVNGKSLYLRGDGVKGSDVSHMIGVLQGLSVSDQCVVRGELVLRTEDAAGIGRSIVNGWMHRRDDLPKEASKIRFVAYQLIEPSGLCRSDQMKWLSAHGFETPWWSTVARDIKEADLMKILTQRRGGAYPIDGLVVAVDSIPVGVGGGEARNPPDSVAFKASLDDQKEETTVVGIVWTTSRHNALIPRIQIEPVEIGGAKIEWLSGHNASYISENQIGAGARIIVRRSGDVIPALDSVLEPCLSPLDIPGHDWQWDASHVHAIVSAASPSKALLHALQTLGVEGIGPGLVDKLVEGGITTMLALWNSKAADLAPHIGSGRAEALLKFLKKARESASYSTLLIASNRLPRGVGERKMRVLFEHEPNPRKWSPSSSYAGWSEESLHELVKALPSALAWVEGSFPSCPVKEKETVNQTLKQVVFTGVRDKDLELLLPSKGYCLQDTVSRSTEILVRDTKESTKTKKAASLGITMMSISEFKNLLGLK